MAWIVTWKTCHTTHHDNLWCASWPNIGHRINNQKVITYGACELAFKQRLKLVPYETAVGLVLTLSSVVTYLLIG